MIAKIKKGDKVQVLTGKDSGKQGTVISVLPKNGRVLVEGVNKVKRHEKFRPAQGRSAQEGGIITKELPVNLSNVALICPVDGPVRSRIRVDADGSKVRICSKCESELG
ncbi:MAG: 50S ribosomal protein L24 [Actinobacteria bacterium]|nr:50S ribosomal protein L24 [Actinomycetota bacterium]